MAKLCLLVLVLFITGCKKDLFERREIPLLESSVSSKNFFANYDYRDTEINLLIANIKSSESKYFFLDKVSKKHGIPSWSNVL